MSTIRFYASVQELLPLVEARMRAETKGYHPELQAALDHLLNSGGKRVRPTIGLLVGGMVGADEEQLIPMAAAIELLHTATLVHDDLIDGALLRRGIPTLNADWSPSATILTGDFIFSRAAELAAETSSVELLRLFARTLSTIVNGEITQIFTSRGLASREDYYQRIYAKTASLFELAASVPALLSVEGEGYYETLKVYGREVGMAFQIVDDVFDFSSDQSILGKPVSNDLKRGLFTLPVLYYLEENPDGAGLVAEIRDGRAGDKAMEKLVEAVNESEAIQQSLGEAEEFIGRGLEALAECPATPEREALEELAEFVVSRVS